MSQASAGSPRPGRAWMRVVMATAVVGFALSLVGLAKAAHTGGTGFQILMVGVAAFVLFVGLLVYRRFRLAATRGATASAPIGQHVAWLGIIRIAAFVAVVLSAIGAVRSKESQTMAGVMLVFALWVMTIAVRLDGAARRARSTEQAT